MDQFPGCGPELAGFPLKFVADEAESCCTGYCWRLSGEKIA